MAGNFVGRREILSDVLGASAEPGQQGSVFIVQGIPGSGRSALLDQLRLAVQKPEDGPGGAVISIPGSHYQAPGRGRGTCSLVASSTSGPEPATPAGAAAEGSAIGDPPPQHNQRQPAFADR